MTLFDPQAKSDFVLNDGLVFAALGKEEFVGNTTMWLKKDYTIMGVRQNYGHLCAISLNTLFRGLLQCFIVKDEAY